MSIETQDYVVVSGKYHHEGVTYVKGDKIALTADKAEKLVNIVAPLADVAVQMNAEKDAEVAALKEQNAVLTEELKAANEQILELQETLDEIEAKAKNVDGASVAPAAKPATKGK